MSAPGVISLNWRRAGHASSDDLCVVSDERLVAAAKIGHKGAFDDLYQRHAEKMLRITYRITRNRQDTEDAVQESLANAFSRLASFAGASRFSTWLTRIVINAALMKLRKKHLSREVPMEEPPERADAPLLYAPIDPAPNPEEWYSVRERNRILREAVAKLRPKLREIVEVHGLSDNSIQKTAEILGISTGAAKARMFHARTSLRREPELRVIVERTKAATGSSRLGARR